MFLLSRHIRTNYTSKIFCTFDYQADKRISHNFEFIEKKLRKKSVNKPDLAYLI